MSKDRAGKSVAMRYSHGDLAILSAEIYTPGLPHAATGPTIRTRKAAARTSDDGPRKRAKIRPTSGPFEREEEEKKRTRGRPRLDVKDETAADVSPPPQPLPTKHVDCYGLLGGAIL